MTPTPPPPAMPFWAESRRLRYELTGSLPTVSKILRDSAEPGARPPRLTRGPARWSEHLCRGVLPGGVEGTLAHHSIIVKGTGDGDGQSTYRATIAVAPVIESMRLVRGLGGYTHALKVISLRAPNPALAQRKVQLPGGRFSWVVPTEMSDATLAEVFGTRVTRAIEALPDARYEVSLRDGWLSVALVGQHVTDPATLDAISELLSALATSLRAVAAAQPTLVPGELLPAPRPLAAPEPPPDFRGKGALLGALRVFGMTQKAERRDAAMAASHSELDALVAGYAHARGLREIDARELCRRFQVPLFGSPVRALQGDFGFLLLWRNRNELGPYRFAHVAIAADRGGGWVVTHEWVTEADRTPERFDALLAQVDRVRQDPHPPAQAHLDPVHAGTARVV